MTGRKKDLIIVAGRNLYPHDIEEAVGELSGIKPGRAVAFGVFDEVVATERAVVLAEVTMPRDDAAGVARLGAAIRALVQARFGVTLADVRLFHDPVLHKSTSGKLSRARNRAYYESELLEKA